MNTRPWGGDKKTPVIMDTDIGSDIDDTWALVMMLKSPELDVKLITTDTGDTTYRAKVVAKLLEIAGLTDVPIGIGPAIVDAPSSQAPWVEGYDLSGYPGTVHHDGVGAIVDTIMGSPEPVTLICIGPVPNIAAALEREPRIAERARFVGMHGSIRRGYGGSSEVAQEYNVVRDPHSCQAAFTADWDVTITPIDTCGIVTLEGEKYRAVRDCEDPLIQAVIENYRIWTRKSEWARNFDPGKQSSVLFDTVAVYLAFAEELLEMEDLGIRVTDDGYTVIDETAKVIHCATDWKDLPAFENLLVQRLTGWGTLPPLPSKDRFPKINEATRLARLEPPRRKVRMVLDTDTYNEIDDQYALVYSLLSPESLQVEAIYAAPFANDLTPDPAEGMEMSYEEILRLLDRLDVSPDGFVYRGSTGYLPDWEHPERSEAALDLVEKAMSCQDDLLYVVAIGVITNVASAILIEPEIVDRIVVVWLGGQPLYWPSAWHFNIGQDLHASRLIFDCGVPLVHVPCDTVTTHLTTSVPEMAHHVQGQGAIGDYLFEIFKAFIERHHVLSKEIYDISTLAYLINDEWVPTELVHSPILTDQMTWSIDHSRHLMRQATFVHRDPIFSDLYAKLQAHS